MDTDNNKTIIENALNSLCELERVMEAERLHDPLSAYKYDDPQIILRIIVWSEEYQERLILVSQFNIELLADIETLLVYVNSEIERIISERE